MIGKPGGAVLITLAIAKSRLSIIALASNKTALDRLRKPCCDRLKSVASQVHTLTYDNGKEFAYHGEIAEELKARGDRRTPLSLMGARPEREHQRPHTSIPTQGHQLPVTYTPGCPEHHGQTQQSTQ